MAGTIEIPEPTLKDRLWKAKIDGKGEPQTSGALMDAAKAGQLWRINYLVTEKDVHIESWNGGAIGRAAEAGQFDAVDLLLQLGASVDGNGGAPIDHAVKNDDRDMVNFLLDRGANIDPPCRPPINVASEAGNLDMVKLLVERGADINIGCEWLLADGDDSDGDAPVRKAAEKGHLDVVKYLVERGCDASFKLWLPMKLAARNGHDDVVEYFLENGAPLDELDEDAQAKWRDRFAQKRETAVQEKQAAFAREENRAVTARDRLRAKTRGLPKLK